MLNNKIQRSHNLITDIVITTGVCGVYWLRMTSKIYSVYTPPSIQEYTIILCLGSWPLGCVIFSTQQNLQTRIVYYHILFVLHKTNRMTSPEGDD